MVPPRLLAVLALVLATPLLSGAGCHAHYAAHLQGQVTIAPEHADLEGVPIRLLFVERDPGGCVPMWGDCPEEPPSFSPVGGCEGQEARRIVVTAGDDTYPLDWCSGLVGVDYQAHLGAFLDVDGDGVLDPGEPFGTWEHDPIDRDKEQAHQPITLRIDQVR